MKKFKCSFEAKETILGRVNAGNLILWDKQLWIVLNPCVEKKAKLIRTLTGEQHKSIVLNIESKVHLVLKSTPKL